MRSTGLRFLLALGSENIPRAQQIELDLPVLIYTLIISLLTGIVFGLIPARHALKLDLNTSLKEGGRGGYSKERNRLRNALVVAEVAVSVLLLVGAGLLIRSFWRLQKIDLGFNTDHLLTMRLYPPASVYPDDQKAADFYDRLLQRLQTMPGVREAAVSSEVNLGGQDAVTVLQAEGHQFELSGVNLAAFRVISPGYFRTMGIRLIRGRFLEESDQSQSKNAVVINESLARAHSPKENPLGHRFRLLDALPENASTVFMTVVGVVADAKNDTIITTARQEAYVPLHQRTTAVANMGYARTMVVCARTSSDPISMANAIRDQVWTIDRTIPITDVRTMDQIIEAGTTQQRFATILLGVFAFIGLALAAIGIYGVISFSVTQRTSEIGIRMALGARTSEVIKLVIGQGMILAFIGLLIGLVAAFVLTRLMEGLLYGVSSTDAITFISFPAILAIIAFAACYIPARRASKIDPMVALRYE